MQQSAKITMHRARARSFAYGKSPERKSAPSFCLVGSRYKKDTYSKRRCKRNHTPQCEVCDLEAATCRCSNRSKSLYYRCVWQLLKQEKDLERDLAPGLCIVSSAVKTDISAKALQQSVLESLTHGAL